jgi:hypothetical protein
MGVGIMGMPPDRNCADDEASQRLKNGGVYDWLVTAHSQPSRGNAHQIALAIHTR